MFAMFKSLLGRVHLPDHFKQALSEDGVGSFSRYAGAYGIVVASLWVFYAIVKAGGHIPDLSGVALWVTSTSAPYGANQAKKVAAAIKGSPTKDTATPQDPA
jgi:hypothetical protein